MTQLDELNLLRFDAETGRVTAVEAVEIAAGIIDELQGQADLYHRADAELSTHVGILQRIVDCLEGVERESPTVVAGVALAILKTISFTSRGSLKKFLKDVDDLEQVLENDQL